MTLEKAFELWDECEQFENTGVVPNDAKLRVAATLAYPYVTRATSLLMVSREVYLELAKELVSREKARWRG